MADENRVGAIRRRTLGFVDLFLVLAMSSQEDLDLPQNGIFYSFAVAVKKSFEPCAERNDVLLRSILATENPVCVNQKIGRNPPVILH